MFDTKRKRGNSGIVTTVEPRYNEVAWSARKFLISRFSLYQVRWKLGEATGQFLFMREFVTSVIPL